MTFYIDRIRKWIEKLKSLQLRGPETCFAHAIPHVRDRTSRQPFSKLLSLFAFLLKNNFSLIISLFFGSSSTYNDWSSLDVSFYATTFVCTICFKVLFTSCNTNQKTILLKLGRDGATSHIRSFTGNSYCRQVSLVRKMPVYRAGGLGSIPGRTNEEKLLFLL